MADSNKSDNGKLALEIAAIAGGYFFIVKPILKAATTFLHFDPVSAAKITAQKAVTPAKNPFNINYKPFTDNFNASPPKNADGSIMSRQEYYTTVKILYNSYVDNGPGKAGNDPKWTWAQNFGTSYAVYDVAQLAEDIYEKLSAWFYSDASAVIADVRTAISKVEIASISNYVYWNYNQDLLNLLDNGANPLSIIPVISDGLADSALAALIDFVNNLPEQSQN